jgi:hypothetical protein
VSLAIWNFANRKITLLGAEEWLRHCGLLTAAGFGERFESMGRVTTMAEKQIYACGWEEGGFFDAQLSAPGTMGSDILPRYSNNIYVNSVETV